MMDAVVIMVAAVIATTGSAHENMPSCGDTGRRPCVQRVCDPTAGSICTAVSGQRRGARTVPVSFNQQGQIALDHLLASLH